MRVMLGMAKNEKLWHITRDKKVSYCGQSELASFIYRIELIGNELIMCPECIKEFRRKEIEN